MMVGIVFGPHVLNLVNVGTWGNSNDYVFEITRVVVSIQLIATALRYEKKKGSRRGEEGGEEEGVKERGMLRRGVTRMLMCLRSLYSCHCLQYVSEKGEGRGERLECWCTRDHSFSIVK